MSKKIKHKRGLKANLPTLDEGELAFTTDEKRPYIGSNDGNVGVLVEDDKTELLTGIGAANTQIETTNIDLEQRGINPKLLGAIGNNVANDTQAFANSINRMNPNNSVVSWSVDVKGGVVHIPTGVYKIGTLIMKSNITIKGQGAGKTVLVPNFSNKNQFMFDVEGTTTTSRLVNFELRDLSLLQAPGGQYNIYQDESTRMKASGINFTYTSSCKLENIVMSGFGGHAIKAIEHYDSHWDNIQIFGSGSETHAGILIGVGDSDGTNALHVTNCRFEEVRDITFLGVNNKLLREMQFIGGKFENANIKYQGTACINFVGVHFTWQREEPCFELLTDINTESHGLKFVGCSFLCTFPQGTLYRGTDATHANFVGCSFKGFTKVIDTGMVSMVGNEFFFCKVPVINASDYSVINDNVFRGTQGNDNCAIKIYGQCQVIGNRFMGIYGTNIGAIEIGYRSNNVSFNNSVGNTNTKGVYLLSTATNNEIHNNAIPISGASTTWTANNNYQPVMGLKLPHSPQNNAGQVSFDINTRQFKIHDGTVQQNVSILRSGTTTERTALPTNQKFIALQFFDTTLGKMCIWNGTAWVNALGETV